MCHPGVSRATDRVSSKTVKPLSTGSYRSRGSLQDDNVNMKILITGIAGFIGYHTAQRLLARGDDVIGVDNFNDSYDPTLKRARIADLKNQYPGVKIYEIDIAEYQAFDAVFKSEQPDKVCHLAAQAGVRYSLTNPFTYERTNILGTLNILGLGRENEVNDLVYAASSSVYGNSKELPFAEARIVGTIAEQAR